MARDALAFLGGLLQLLRQSGYSGLVVVLDEVETVQRMNAQPREKSLNALRQLMDMLGERRSAGTVPRGHRYPRLLRGLQGPQGRCRLSFSACRSISETILDGIT